MTSEDPDVLYKSYGVCILSISELDSSWSLQTLVVWKKAQAIHDGSNPNQWKGDGDFAENSLLISPQWQSFWLKDSHLLNENLRRAYRPQIKILVQEQVRQCERSWLKLCKWQRVHSEWQLFLRRLRWLIKGFHLPLTEINHSTHTQHTHTFSQHRRGAERAEHRDQVWTAMKWQGLLDLAGREITPGFLSPGLTV